MNCIICNKTFTGEVCYQQHLHSERHKKKARLEQTETFVRVKPDNTLKLPFAAERIPCDTCNISFETFQNYKKHVESWEHAQRITNNNNSGKEMPFPSKASVSSHDIDVNLIEKKDDDRIINLEECVNQKLYYKSCDPCKKKFSGPEPYQQHLESIGHKKKLALYSNSNIAEVSSTGFITSESSAVQTVSSVGAMNFACELCDKTCSGPIPYDQHLQSEVHKKKVRNKALIEQYKSINTNENSLSSNAISSIMSDEENQPRGAEHNSKIISEVDVTDGSSKNVDELPERNSDSILSDWTNLDIITVDQLDVKIFPVDSEIKFD